MKLSGKVAVVVGTSPNIGGGIIEALAAEGAAIGSVDARADYASDCAAYIRGTGGKAHAFVCDVANEADVERTAAEALEAFGHVDILVNNAAFFNRKGVIDTTYAEWQNQLNVILGGTFLMTKHVGRSMIQRGRGGVIINIISTAGHQGEPGNIAYSTAKAGLLNFTQAAAMEFAAHGIRVNSVTPTATDPQEQVERAARWGRQFTLPENIEAVMAPFRRGIPMQKLPRPSDYGKAVAFLASDDATMITGVDLRVDGGAVAKYWAWTPNPGPQH